MLFGWLNEPAASSIVSDTAVVFCGPAGGSNWGRIYQHLAEQLSLSGIWALRFHNYGVADSEGQDGDPELACAWIDSIESAIQEVVKRSGVTRICLVGFRLGATLAIAAAARGFGCRVDDLVLWAPFTTDKEFRHEIFLAEKLYGTQTLRDLFGFLPNRFTLDDLARLTTASITERPCSRALILARNSSHPEAGLVSHLQSLGVETTYESIEGDPQVLTCTYETATSSNFTDQIKSWILRPSQRPQEVPELLVPDLAKGLPKELPKEQHHHSWLRHAPSNDETSYSVGDSVPIGETVLETPVFFGGQRSVFGIVSEPKHSSRHIGKPAILFINPGRGHHIGPGRLHVTAARHWAALGFTTLRFDRSGSGDSSAQDLPDQPRSAIHPWDDINLAIDFLTQRYSIDSFVLFGICNGAQVAFDFALGDQRVVDLQLINARTFSGGGSGIHGAPQLWRMLHRWRSWPMFFDRGGLNRARRVAKRCTRAVQSLLSDLTQSILAKLQRTPPAASPLTTGGSGTGAPDSNRIRNSFVTLSRRGVRPLLVYDADDIGHAFFRCYVDATARELELPVHVFEKGGHVFADATSGTSLLTVLTDHLQQHWGEGVRERTSLAAFVAEHI